MKTNLILLLSFIPVGIFAPDAQGDNGVLQKSTDDTTRIRMLNEHAFKFAEQNDLDSCLHYASKALNLSNNLLSSKRALNSHEFLKQSKVLKAKSLANIAMGLINSNPVQALDTLQDALLLMKEVGKKADMADIYSSIALVYDSHFQNESALKNHLKSVRLYRETGNKSKLASELTYLAIAQRNLGKYGDALGNLMESLKISRQTNNSRSAVETYLAMGFVYLFVEKWDDALESQHEALRIYKKMNDTLGIARVYNDIGVTNMRAGNFTTALKNHKAALEIRLKSKEYYYTFSSYSYIGEIYEELANFPEALRNYEAGLKYAERSGAKTGIIDANLECGMIHFKTSGYDNALQHFLVALELSRKIEDRTGESKAAMNIADICISRNETGKAISWFKKAAKVSPESSFKFMSGIYKSLAGTYFKIGDYGNAYKYQLLYSQVKDSLVIAENLVKITTLTNRMEIENKQALQTEKYNKMLDIKQSELKRQRIFRNFILFGMFVILVMAVIFFIRFIEKNKLNTKLNNLLSNLKSTQSQLIQSEKMASLGELTAGIAHEIQNPLNFVNNFSEVNSELIAEMKDEIYKGNLEEVKALADDIADNEQKINQHGKRADAIVKGMLLHSRSRNGINEPTDINALADEYLRLAYHGLRAKDKTFNATLKTDFDETIGNINIIPQDIGRVILNLITNAFYAVTEKKNQFGSDYEPTVSVSTRKINGKIEVHVKDNGNGIPQNILAKIFQPFFTTKPAGQGTGLGLSISYDIVTEGHGGELKVEITEGGGAEFIIRLPVKI
ncbi:MAG: tetratricopeptide repeat-containing sensor histidine kinase [Bacteroidales bacterium]